MDKHNKSQRQRLLLLVKHVHLLVKGDISTLMITQQKLNQILSEAQNSPPEGGSDGSLEEIEWTRIRDFSSALGDFLFKLEMIVGD